MGEEMLAQLELIDIMSQRIIELQSLLAEVEAELIRSAACSQALCERVKAVRRAVE